MNMHSMKNRDIWRKICILCPAFPVSWDICEKKFLLCPIQMS